MEQLRQAILAKYRGMAADELTPTVWLQESFPALQADEDVIGEGRDALYLRNAGTFSLADDEFLVLYGVNHQATGKATYSNFSIYDSCKACGVTAENNATFAGSARSYFTPAQQPPHVDQLYAWRVARKPLHDKDPKHSTLLPTGPCPGAVAIGNQLFVGFRSYVEPATAIGPDPAEILFDRVIKFSPNAPVLSDIKFSTGQVADSPFPLAQVRPGTR